MQLMPLFEATISFSIFYSQVLNMAERACCQLADIKNNCKGVLLKTQTQKYFKKH